MEHITGKKESFGEMHLQCMVTFFKMDRDNFSCQSMTNTGYHKGSFLQFNGVESARFILFLLAK